MSSPLNEHETMSSHPLNESHLSPVALDTMSTVSKEEPSINDPPESISTLHEHETVSSHAQNELQLSPVALEATSTVEEPSMNEPPKSIITLHEQETMSPQTPAGPQLSPAGPDTAPTLLQTIESGKSPSTESVLNSQNSSPPSPPLPSDLTSTFPIMKLPPELRLMIFDEVFLDLTVRRQRSLMYRNEIKLSEKHQVNDFRPYANLLLTCKELGQEAKKHWEKIYLRKCCFYFWHVSKLYDLALILNKLGKPYINIKYVLRSQYNEGHVGDFCLAETVRKLMGSENVDFMIDQPGVPLDYYEVFSNQLSDRLNQFEADEDDNHIEVREGINEATEDNPVRAVVYRDEAGRKFSRAEWSGPESCKISSNAIQIFNKRPNPWGWGVTFSHYEEMEGKFSGIFWGGYDAAVGYGKLIMWEAMPLCHQFNHYHCQKWDEPNNQSISEELLEYAKRERETLLHWWLRSMTKDPKWLSLGGISEDAMLNWWADYGVENWFIDEVWSDDADHHWNAWYMSGEPWTAIRHPQ